MDMIGFDPELLAMIPRPCEALIFLFPITEKYEAFREEEETHLKIREQNISPNLMFYDQTIGNACGTMALLHSLANNDHLVGKIHFNFFSKLDNLS
jgi:ubiquitin carboxyl-terminal hydrolase L3